MLCVLHELVQFEKRRGELRVLPVLVIVVYAEEELLVECVDQDIFRFVPCGVNAGCAKKKFSKRAKAKDGKVTYVFDL